MRITRADEGISVATVEKQRDGPAGITFAYGLRVVELGADADGEPVTSCVIEEREAPAATGKLTPNARKFLEALEMYVADCGTPNPGGTGWPAQGSVRVVAHDAFIAWAKGKSSTARDRDKRRAAERAVDDLIARGLVQMNDGQLWLVKKGRT